MKEYEDCTFCNGSGKTKKFPNGFNEKDIALDRLVVLLAPFTMEERKDMVFTLFQYAQVNNEEELEELAGQAPTLNPDYKGEKE